MTGNRDAGLPRGAADLRGLIREVLRDALATGYLDRTPLERPADLGPAFGDGAAHGLLTLPGAPPSEIPAGTIHQSVPLTDTLRKSDTSPSRPAAGSRSVGGRSGGAVSGRGEAPVGGRSGAAVNGRGEAAAGDPAGSIRHVRLETDEDLREFVLTVLRLADNPARRRDLMAGRLRFTLSEPPSGQPQSAASRAGRATCRIEAGAVTERAVQAAAKQGERLVLGRRAVLTPLARDRALALGVPIERER
ncbi:MAG: hypothetical protein ACLQFR_26530 [Streptosporangiaceae bacterium]